jgi:hypothetical protein
MGFDGYDVVEVNVSRKRNFCVVWFRRTAWGVQRGRRRMQAARAGGGPQPKRPYGRFRGAPPAGCRRVRHGMAPVKTLGSAWPTLAIRLWFGDGELVTAFADVLCTFVGFP